MPFFSLLHGGLKLTLLGRFGHKVVVVFRGGGVGAGGFTGVKGSSRFEPRFSEEVIVGAQLVSEVWVESRAKEIILLVRTVELFIPPPEFPPVRLLFTLIRAELSLVRVDLLESETKLIISEQSYTSKGLPGRGGSWACWLEILLKLLKRGGE